MSQYHLFKRLGTIIITMILITTPQLVNSQTEAPLKVGIAGITHSHVHQLLRRPEQGDIKIVGIAESNRDLAKRYADRYGYSMDIVFNTVEEMIAATHPEAVTAFGSIYDHLGVVEACAPKGIHVMVEKPLAVSIAHVKKMEGLAKKHKIHLLTNYETTWYSSNHKAYEMVENNAIGELRKIVVHDGHEGPEEIGVNPEFLEWLTDPIKNGGGAVIDFGCYGANLVTWLMKGERPISVLAMTQTIKPEKYPKVDDEATIILKFPKSQAIIQASWNWPFSRKDMEIYGKTGFILSDNATDIRYRLDSKEAVKSEKLEKRIAPYNDPFSFLSAVIRQKITLPPYALSSLENNVVVVEILEMAKESAKTGKAVQFKK